MEVQLLSIVNHPNLVKFIGYCVVDAERGPQRLLVCEFMPNKTLDHHLFNKDSPSLPWDTRLKIALGAANGLLYLHEGLEIPVVFQTLCWYLRHFLVKRFYLLAILVTLCYSGFVGDIS
jgi:serine/threonine protein kinase